jgi:hypothetical protein
MFSILGFILWCVRDVRIWRASKAVVKESTSVRLGHTNGLSPLLPGCDKAIAAFSCRIYLSKSIEKSFSNIVLELFSQCISIPGITNTRKGTLMSVVGQLTRCVPIVSLYEYLT